MPMKNDAIICNIGHFDCKIQVLTQIKLRTRLEQYTMAVRMLLKKLDEEVARSHLSTTPYSKGQEDKSIMQYNAVTRHVTPRTLSNKDRSVGSNEGTTTKYICLCTQANKSLDMSSGEGTINKHITLRTQVDKGPVMGSGEATTTKHFTLRTQANKGPGMGFGGGATRKQITPRALINKGPWLAPARASSLGLSPRAPSPTRALAWALVRASSPSTCWHGPRWTSLHTTDSRGWGTPCLTTL